MGTMRSTRSAAAEPTAAHQADANTLFEHRTCPRARTAPVGLVAWGGGSSRRDAPPVRAPNPFQPARRCRSLGPH